MHDFIFIVAVYMSENMCFSLFSLRVFKLDLFIWDI